MNVQCRALTVDPLIPGAGIGRVCMDGLATAAFEQAVQWLTNGRPAYTGGSVTIAAYANNMFNLKSYTYGEAF